jgi:hypothetical protein
MRALERSEGANIYFHKDEMLMTSSNLELRFFIFVFNYPLLREALRLFQPQGFTGALKNDLGCAVAFAERRNGFGSVIEKSDRN